VEDMGALGTAHDGGLDGLPRFRADPSGDDASAADAAGEGALHEPSVTDDVPDLDADFGDPARRSSIWPHVEERIADLVSEQRSTLVFANSRRLAERLTARLNELWY